MAFDKFKTGMSLFFQSFAFFIVFFMLMRFGLQTVHQSPVIHSPLLAVKPIEMREASDVDDPSYLKPQKEFAIKSQPIQEVKEEELPVEEISTEVEKEVKTAKDLAEDVKVLVKKTFQNGFPFISVSVSKIIKPEVAGEETVETVDDSSVVEESPVLEKSLNVEEKQLQEKEEVVILENPFTIQLVTYRSEERAKEEVKNLEKLGYSAFIIPSGNFYQVCINRFQAKEAALAKLHELKTAKNFYSYQDAYVRPVMR